MKLLVLLIPALIWSASLKELKKLTPSQVEVLKKSMAYGKEYNLSYTLAAIAWKESNFGKYLVGRTTPDYGVFQNNIKTFSRRFKDRIQKSGLTKDEVIHALTHSFDIGAEAALAELKFWMKSRNWLHAVQSYNDGTHISSKGESYGADIVRRVALLKKFI